MGHLNFNRATLSLMSLARMGHQLSKLNDIPAHEKELWEKNPDNCPFKLYICQFTDKKYQ